MRCSEAIFKNKIYHTKILIKPKEMKKISKTMTSLHFAAEAGSKEITEWLISIGQSINATDDCDRTPLDLAIEDHCCIGPIKAAKNETADLLRKHGGKTGAELRVAGN